MTVADCAGVAEIRVRGWRAAYRGMMPQSHLDAMSVQENTARLRTRLRTGDGSVVNLVAEAPGGLVGWACHGPYRDGEVAPGSAELYALYVHPEHCGTGIGGALLAESLRRCRADGRTRVHLWVLKANVRARRFYERWGFTADGAEEPYEVDGVEVPEVRYTKDLRDGRDLTDGKGRRVAGGLRG
ncbi:GNAT family N-acetyltransferase [Streptomyces sp. DSM 41014]|uniref:GNAT family N-acetyltransferase n=1 Tax=Streptomyces hintoniae TaxID=3075521 RepID=A0ABU2UI25_9ACTN|nr:GNAT family N-acetyltransferase [Streptomyces sp. DSM 41014]MDT0472859.1 GNAT family N-acetyltransferase [Streptomyces sp. DSM 41014]